MKAETFNLIIIDEMRKKKVVVLIKYMCLYFNIGGEMLPGACIVGGKNFLDVGLCSGGD